MACLYSRSRLHLSLQTDGFDQVALVTDIARLRCYAVTCMRRQQFKAGIIVDGVTNCGIVTAKFASPTVIERLVKNRVSLY